ncbi:MAG TPA: LuxR C-terminal-related transcriptional regulator [Roseiflexaceae bacterium]
MDEWWGCEGGGAALTPPPTGEVRKGRRPLLTYGKSNGEIAISLSLSTKTVSNYVSNTLNKLQVADRTEAIIRARDAGLGIS